MLSEKEVALVYETLLSSPGMNEVVKMDLRIPRKNVLLLVKVIEQGLQVKKGEVADGLLQSAGAGLAEELYRLAADLLQKAGLSDMAEKLHDLQATAAGK
jgi:hypothetical protein